MHCDCKFVQPEFRDWKIVSELSIPEPRVFPWGRKIAKTGETDISGGIKIIPDFPDRIGILQTAYDDLNRFFSECGIPADGKYGIITEKGKPESYDSYEIIISPESCRIIAGNAEGVRRGIYYLEDLLLGTDGPFLRLGSEKRSPWVKNRISYFFGCPPSWTCDELLDDGDYYSDEYLNRLAHEGINGLWKRITFKELCKTSFTPENGADSARRLGKLRRIADKCLRYGIKTYIFCIEPAAWNADSPALIRHPGLGGVKKHNAVFFCPFSESSQKYLYESVYGIFKAVPVLGGMINISYGERDTTCLSNIWPTDDRTIDCPVCSGKKPWEILHSSLSAMEKGMRDAAPEARLISWLYMPAPEKVADWVYEIPKHTPENVILQVNLESGGIEDQLGKPRSAGDYWLSYVGPADRFKSMAQNALAAKAEMSAKIQVGCSHEIESVPFIPVPSLLYRKYRQMHDLGISSVMQCWGTGNYPGIMNKTAGMLAFEDFKVGEKDFLKKLALPEWGGHADNVVEAWTVFADGYSNYPLSNLFQYYGPMHDGIVWPLYLYPVRESLLPNWVINSGRTSGDAIGECLDNHSIEEAMELCREMAGKWSAGVKIMKSLCRHFHDNPARLKDIGLAEAIGIQFESGYNILRFYVLREEFFNSSDKSKSGILDQMEFIVSGEIERSARMIELCEHDSRLGFNSEAEGYKYFPGKLKWRIGMLKSLLSEDFPKARACPPPLRDLEITNVPFGVARSHRMQGARNENIEIFERRATMQSVASRHAPKGRRSSGRFRRLSILIYSRIYSSVVSWKQPKSLAANGILVISRYLKSDKNTPGYNCSSGAFENCESFKWKASGDAQYLTIEIDCEGKGEPDQFFVTVIFKNTSVAIIDLYRSGLVKFSRPGCSRNISETLDGWRAEVKIPMESGVKTARLSIIRLKAEGRETRITAWGGRPLKYRLLLGMYNPKETGLLSLM